MTESRARKDIERTVNALIAEMTLEEKVGQMTLPEKNSVREGDVARYALGGVLSGGGGYPRYNTPVAWREMVSAFADEATRSRLGIPLLYGVDAVHGHAAVYGATVFPHNVGLGATRDPELVERIGQATAREMAATGIRWNYAPVVAVPEDLRWGRAYEAYSQETALVAELGAAYVRGLQGPDLARPDAVLATPKHFVGDGAARWGTSTTVMIGRRFSIDQGDAPIDEATLRARHLPPYAAAVQAGARAIMVSFSSWNGKKMHGNRYLLQSVLKGELGFPGFLVSDWGAVDQLPGDYRAQVAAAINAGLDMIMVPYDYRRFIATLTEAVRAGDVPIERIDDAVRRILRVKVELGLFEPQGSGTELLATIGCSAHRNLAREAVRRSVTLLVDRGVLPLPKDLAPLLVGGEAADDIGLQCGGWTIEWQGKRGRIVPGTTILEAIRLSMAQPDAVEYDPRGLFAGVDRAAVGIAVVGEEPYAEGFGDRAEPTLGDADLALVRSMRAKVEKLVLLVISGRPLVLGEAGTLADAIVAAWLPGTEGAGVADVLVGDHPFEGRLPVAWPRSVRGFDPAEGEPPLFPLGHSGGA